MKRLIPVIFMALGALVTACDTFRAGVFEDEMVMPLEGSEADSLFYKVSIQYASKGMLIPAMEKMNAAIVAQAFDMEGVDIGPPGKTTSPGNSAQSTRAGATTLSIITGTGAAPTGPPPTAR